MWLKQWKQDVKELEAQVRAIKAKLRTDWRVSYPEPRKGDNYPGFDQWDLMVLRSTLTHLYQYRAANRGKVHVQELPKHLFAKAPDTHKYDKLKEDAKALRTMVDLQHIVQNQIA